MAKAKSKNGVKMADKKPRPFNHAGYELASISGAFFCHELNKKLPNVIYIHCEELSVKKARKLAKWLLQAASYIEQSTKKESI